MRILKSLFLTLSVFGFFGWVYIAVNAEVHPWTLAMPLTHFLPWPREDTFGSACFLISMLAFFAWNLVKDK